MTPTCPNCGSVAIERRGKVAACMNPRCVDNGTVKPLRTFRPDIIDKSYDPRRVALDGGGYRIMPVYHENAA